MVLHYNKLELPKLLLFFFALSFFVDINFLKIGDFLISTKFLTTFFGSVFILFFLGRFKIVYNYLFLGITFYFVFNLSQIISGDLNIASLIYFLAYPIYTMLLVQFIQKGNYELNFFSYFVYCAIIVSIIAILQVFNFLPVFENNIDDFVLNEYNINQGDILDSRFKRGTGLMFDGNFFGMILAIAFGINRFTLKSNIATFTIFLGILASFSRSALLALIFSYIFTFPLNKFSINNFLKSFKLLPFFIILILFLILFLPGDLISYFSSRFVELFDFMSFDQNIDGASILESSTSIRIFAFIASYYIFINNPLIGVGISGSRDAFIEVLGYNTHSHNTFIEFVVVSGILGLFISFIFLRVIFQKFNLEGKNLKLLRSTMGPIFISFMTLTHMQSLFLFFPFFIKDLIGSTKNEK